MLTDDEFHEQLARFTHTAYRLELQPSYSVEHAAAAPRSWPVWSERVAEHVRQGRHVVRIRVRDDPHTDDHRAGDHRAGDHRAGDHRADRDDDRRNIEAGEVIGYLTRRRAYEIGLLPAAGDRDWWLLDEERLVVMAYDGAGVRVHTELSTDPVHLELACRWWDLAVRAVREDAG